MAQKQQKLTAVDGGQATAASDKPKLSASERRARAAAERDKRNGVYKAQGGKCYVSGVALDPLEYGTQWRVVDGRAVTTEIARRKGRKTWDDMKKGLAAQLDRAKRTIESLSPVVATDNEGRQVVRFNGETPAE